MKSIYIPVFLLFCFVVFLQVYFNPVYEQDYQTDESPSNNIRLYSSYFLDEVIYLNPKKEKNIFNDLNKTNGLAFDSNGNIFVVEHTKSQIIKYNAKGTILETYKVTDGYPLHIINSYNSNDMIFTNVTDNSINKLSQDGNITKLYKGSPLETPVGLTYNYEGVLHVSNYEDKKVFTLINEELNYITTMPQTETVKCRQN